MFGLNVLIVGASIAGPTAAYWFAKAGAKVTIIERFPKLRTSGQGIDIRTVGISLSDCIGRGSLAQPAARQLAGHRQLINTLHASHAQGSGHGGCGASQNHDARRH